MIIAMNDWKVFIPAFFLLLISVPAPAQFIQYEYQYRGYQAAPQKMVIDESFDDDINLAWQTWSTSPASIGTIDGKYCVRSSAFSTLEHWFDLPLETYDDYELDLSIALRNSGETLNNSYGFIFGTTHHGARLALTMGADGQYSIQELDSRGDAFVWQFDHAPELVPYRFQQFIVRKIANEVTFMVDGEVIYEWLSDGVSGERVGLLLGRGAEVMVDHIRVMKLAGPILPDKAATEIELTSHEISWENGYGHISTVNDREVLQGRITPMEQWTALWINEEIVPTKADGSFSVSVNLLEGTNSIRISALLPEGKQIKRHLNIQRVPPAIAKPQVLGEVYLDPTDFEELNNHGRNFLVLIGMNQYDYWNDLHNAVKDCEDVGKVLVDNYQFDATHVVRLYNEDGTRENILETMEWLQDELRKEDNLLIYYAGHGYIDEQANLGYWVPSDGRMNKVPDYIPNSTIHDYLSTIDCHHTLLIADACFSGSLARTRGNIPAEIKSRWVFASGNSQERVFDGAPGTNSPFAEEMIEFLLDNKHRAFYSNELIESVSRGVTERVRQHPIGVPVMPAGDQGGLFPFIPSREY